MTPAPCLHWEGGGPAAHFKGGGQIPPWGQPKLTRAWLCHGDGGRLLWQRGEVWGPFVLPCLRPFIFPSRLRWPLPAQPGPVLPAADPLPAGFTHSHHPSPSPILAPQSTAGAQLATGVVCASLSAGGVRFWLLHIPGVGARAPRLRSVSNFRLVSGSPLSPRGAGQDSHARGSYRGAGGSSSMENSSSFSLDLHGRDGDGAVPVGPVPAVEQAEHPDKWEKNSPSLERGGEERQAGISWPILSSEYSYLGKMPPRMPSDGDPQACWGSGLPFAPGWKGGVILQPPVQLGPHHFCRFCRSEHLGFF